MDIQDPDDTSCTFYPFARKGKAGKAKKACFAFVSFAKILGTNCFLPDDNTSSETNILKQL